MKKNILKSTLVVATLSIAGYGGVQTFKAPSAKGSELLAENVEALSKNAKDKTTIKTCVGLWGECILDDGSESKAPLIEVDF